MNPPPSQNVRDSGFFLLEIIVSIALFALVGTAMVAALHHLSKSSQVARKEIAMQRRFDSVMSEKIFASGDRLTSGTTHFPADGSGIAVSVTVAPENILSSDGTSLDSIFRIAMTGHLENDPTFERSTERLVYHKPHGRVASQ